MADNAGPKPVKGKLADHKPADRKCLGLGCGKMFASKGAGNRKCPKCEAKSRGVYHKPVIDSKGH